MSSVLSYTADALANEASDVITLADTEQLWAHAEAVRLRMADFAADSGDVFDGTDTADGSADDSSTAEEG